MIVHIDIEKDVIQQKHMLVCEVISRGKPFGRTWIYYKFPNINSYSFQVTLKDNKFQLEWFSDFIVDFGQQRMVHGLSQTDIQLLETVAEELYMIHMLKGENV